VIRAPGLEPDIAAHRRPPGSGGGTSAARRDVLLQCERCHIQWTGRLWYSNGQPRLTVGGVPLRRPFTHPGCGGRFRVFDIATNANSPQPKPGAIANPVSPTPEGRNRESS